MPWQNLAHPSRQKLQPYLILPTTTTKFQEWIVSYQVFLRSYFILSEVMTKLLRFWVGRLCHLSSPKKSLETLLCDAGLQSSITTCVSHTSGPNPMAVLLFNLFCIVLGSGSADWAEHPALFSVSASNFLEDMKGTDDQEAEPDRNSTKWSVGLVSHICPPNKQNELTAPPLPTYYVMRQEDQPGTSCGRTLGPSLLKSWVWAAFSLNPGYLRSELSTLQLVTKCSLTRFYWVFSESLRQLGFAEAVQKMT